MAAAARLSVSQAGPSPHHRTHIHPPLDDEIREFWETSEEESSGGESEALNEGGVYPGSKMSNGVSHNLGRTSSFGREFGRKIVSLSGNLGIGSSPKAPREVIVRSSSRQGEYASGIARLRELERQGGVQRPLDERQAGEVLAEMWLKLETLGLEDSRQRDQVGRCILEAELEKAHAKVKLSEWDTVGQGLKNLVKEKDAELQVFRASSAESKKQGQARAAAERELHKLRQDAQSQAADNEKLVSERDHLRIALSDAEMDLQTATALLGQVKQGLVLKEGDEKLLEQKLVRRGDPKLQEQLRKAEEVNRQNEGVIRRLEEQLKAAKEGYIKERQVWVKDAIAQQSTIMQHIKDQEGYAKTKEKEIKRLTLSLDTARRDAAEQLATVKRKEEDLRTQLNSERAASEKRVKEQTKLVMSLEEKLEGQTELVGKLEAKIKGRSQAIASLQKEGETARAQMQEKGKMVESLTKEVERLSRELQVMKAQESSSSRDAGVQEAKVAELTAALMEEKAKMQDLEQQNADFKKDLEESSKKLEESEQVASKLLAEKEAVSAELTGRKADLANAKAELQKQSQELKAREADLANAKAELENHSKELKAREGELANAKAELQNRSVELQKAMAGADTEKIQEIMQLSERLEGEYKACEEKLRSALFDTEAALNKRVAELEAQVQELTAALEKSEAERSRIEGERQNLLESRKSLAIELPEGDENSRLSPRGSPLAGVVESPKGLAGFEETGGNETPKASPRGSEGPGFTRKKSANSLTKQKPERAKSLGTATGNGTEDLLKVLREKEELLSRTTMDMLRQDEELRTQRREASEVAEKFESELKAAREERDKLQLRTEFLRKKVGEMKEQATKQTEQAAAGLHARDVELGRLSAELDSANTEVQQLTKACRTLQMKLSHVGADGALSATSEGSPEVLTRRKRSRTESPGGREAASETMVSLDGWVSPETRVSQLESQLAGKESALRGKLRELQEKEAEVKGLQEILRVLAHQLEEADESPQKGGQDAEKTPQKGPPQSGDVLSAVKAALKAASSPRISVPSPSLRALVVAPSPKEQLALKRECRELYERLERTELDMERKMAEQVQVWRQREGELVKELEGKAMKLQVMEEAFQDLLGRWKEARTEAESAAANAQSLDKRAQEESHAKTMLQKRLEKLEALDKSGDGMWRELARLAATNASLEEQVEQLSTASGGPCLQSASPANDDLQKHRRSASLQSESTQREEALLTNGRSPPKENLTQSTQPKGGADSESAKSSPLGTESLNAFKQSASASPVASPGSDAERAQQLSQSVFDRLAVLKQRYAAEGKTMSPDSGAKSPTEAAKSPTKPADSIPKSPEKPIRSATPELQKEKKGTMRTLVRWFEAKVPTRKSSRHNSPRSSADASAQSTTAVRNSESLPAAFARSLPALDVAAEDRSQGPADVQARLEMLRQRATLAPEESGKPHEVNLRTMLERQRSGDVGKSPEPNKRTETLRREERVSGFGSPQANAIPSWLSWVPPPEATAQEASPAQRQRGGEPTKGATGRWHDVQSRAEEPMPAPSPSSVLERLAVLQARGSAS